jgi:hypothetical protein
MPEHPWRCSQCGTINEPVANSCRTCGKWPSLFDLEDSAVEEDVYEPISAPPPQSAPEPVHTHDAPEPVTVEVETFDPQPVEPRSRRFEPPPTDPVLGEGEREGSQRWVSWLVPIAVVVYIVIQVLASAR